MGEVHVGTDPLSAPPNESGPAETRVGDVTQTLFQTSWKIHQVFEVDLRKFVPPGVTRLDKRNVLFYV